MSGWIAANRTVNYSIWFALQIEPNERTNAASNDLLSLVRWGEAKEARFLNPQGGWATNAQ